LRRGPATRAGSEDIEPLYYYVGIPLMRQVSVHLYDYW
jgi:hypothetical protein